MKESKHDGWHTLIYLETKNKNGRIYPSDLDIIDLQEKIKDKTLMGELGHPDTRTINSENSEYNFNISISRVSHRVEDLKIEDNKLLGRIKVLETPQGNILNDFPEGSIVFRPRSIGTVAEDGRVTIEKIISFDAILKSEDAF